MIVRTATRNAVFLPDPAAGFGHLSRCLSLAAAWQRVGGRAIVWAPDMDDAWRRRWDAAGATVAGHEPTADDDVSWWVVDDYGYEPSPSDAGRRVLVVEDHPPPGEILLRDEFRDVEPVAVRDRARRVLLAPGGAPAPDVAAAFDAAARDLAATLEVAWLRGTDDVVDAMRRADVAVAAAGVTAYELARLGVPSVLVAVAANQEPVRDRLVAAGAAVGASLDDLAPRTLALAADAERRRALAASGPALVDGRGADRVVARMRAADIELRPADALDAERLFRWANDPDTRAGSLSTAPIPWDDHVAWLDRVLASPAIDLRVACLDGEPIGQVRLDRDAEGTTLHYSLAPEHRGRRLAAPLLIAATSERTSGPGRDQAPRGPEVPRLAVRARVKADNLASRRAFELAGIAYEVVR